MQTAHTKSRFETIPSTKQPARLGMYDFAQNDLFCSILQLVFFH